jgi:hypothetical protein
MGVIAVQVPSHQLTPFAMLCAIAALLLVRRLSARGLLPFTLAAVAGWMAFMTIPYLSGNLAALTGSLGKVNATVSSNVGERVAGSEGHMLVVYARVAASVALWALALFAVLRERRRRTLDVRLAALAAAPFALAVLQPYGGEMVLRVYLFALPFVALLVAGLAVPRRAAALRPQRIAVLMAFSLLLLGAFTITRYGNERANLFTRGEVEGVERLYRIAPPGSLLIAVSPNLPWQAQHYVGYDYEVLSRWLKKEPPKGPLVDDLVSRILERRRPAAYVIVTRSQRVYDRLLGSAPWGSVDAFERELRSSGRFQLTYDGRDARIYRLAWAVGVR